jgi:hypothetical protein
VTADEWEETERGIVRAWTAGDPAQALRLIEIVLARGGDDLRAQALVYRG